MANFICVCHKNLTEQQISDVISIFNDRLQNDLTRDATLKSLSKITSNAGNDALIPIKNLSMLTTRIFDLLHKAQRTIHLNTLDTLVHMVRRYPSQFQPVATAIFKEIMLFINDNDMQASALALRVATPTITICPPTAVEAQEFIARSVILSSSHMI